MGDGLRAGDGIGRALGIGAVMHQPERQQAGAKGEPEPSRDGAKGEPEPSRDGADRGLDGEQRGHHATPAIARARRFTSATRDAQPLPKAAKVGSRR